MDNFYVESTGEIEKKFENCSFRRSFVGNIWLKTEYKPDRADSNCDQNINRCSTPKVYKEKQLKNSFFKKRGSVYP